MDGGQHFQFDTHFHESIKYLNYKQNIDRLKTHSAFGFGYRLIRIDYTQINDIGQHIINSVQMYGKLYLSNPQMYIYLTAIIPAEIIAEHCSQLIINTNLTLRCGETILEIIA